MSILHKNAMVGAHKSAARYLVEELLLGTHTMYLVRNEPRHEKTDFLHMICDFVFATYR